MTTPETLSRLLVDGQITARLGRRFTEHGYLLYLVGGTDSPEAAPGFASYPDIPAEADTTVGWAIHHSIAGTDLFPPQCFHHNCDHRVLLNRGTTALYAMRVNTLVGGPTVGPRLFCGRRPGIALRRGDRLGSR